MKKDPTLTLWRRLKSERKIKNHIKERQISDKDGSTKVRNANMYAYLAKKGQKALPGEWCKVLGHQKMNFPQHYKYIWLSEALQNSKPKHPADAWNSGAARPLQAVTEDTPTRYPGAKMKQFSCHHFKTTRIQNNWVW